MRDMLSNKQVVLLGTVTLSGVTPNATSWVDTREFDAATLVLVTQTVTDAGTSAGFTFTAQHADDTAAASAASIVAADAINGTIAVKPNYTLKIGWIFHLRSFLAFNSANCIWVITFSINAENASGSSFKRNNSDLKSA
jgi:hypothetical protein